MTQKELEVVVSNIRQVLESDPFIIEWSVDVVNYRKGIAKRYVELKSAGIHFKDAADQAREEWLYNYLLNTFGLEE